MTWAEAVDWVIRLGLPTGGLAAAVAYVRDRRKAKAEGYVADRTKELEVDAARLENIEKRWGLAQKAWDAEKMSLLAEIARRGERIGQLEAENDEKDRELAAQREEIDGMRGRLDEMAARIDRLRGTPED